jgi:hypothetical protein
MGVDCRGGKLPLHANFPTQHHALLRIGTNENHRQASLSGLSSTAWHPRTSPLSSVRYLLLLPAMCAAPVGTARPHAAHARPNEPGRCSRVSGVRLSPVRRGRRSAIRLTRRERRPHFSGARCCLWLAGLLCTGFEQAGFAAACQMIWLAAASVFVCSTRIALIVILHALPCERCRSPFPHQPRCLPCTPPPSRTPAPSRRSPCASPRRSWRPRPTSRPWPSS